LDLHIKCDTSLVIGSLRIVYVFWGRLCSILSALEDLQNGSAKFRLSLFNYHFTITIPLLPLNDDLVHFSLKGNELLLNLVPSFNFVPRSFFIDNFHFNQK
jgi:hypothetical protein